MWTSCGLFLSNRRRELDEGDRILYGFALAFRLSTIQAVDDFERVRGRQELVIVRIDVTRR